MAAKKWKLSRLYGKTETTFGTDPDTDGSDYTFLKTVGDVTFEPLIDAVERPGQVNDLTRQPHVMGQKGGTLSFKLELKGSGTAADGIASVAAEADPILESAFGTVTRGTGSTITTGASTTSLPLASAAGMSKYMMVIVDCGATHGFVPRFITAIVTNTLTLDRALPATPANGAKVIASTRYTRANSGHKSLALVAERDAVLYTFLGCKVDSLKLSGISARGTALLDVQCSASDWTTTAKASLPTPMAATANTTKAPVVKGACFAVAGTEELMYSAELDMGLTFSFQDATCALGTGQPDSANAGMELVDAAPKGVVKSYYKAQHMTDLVAGTENSLAVATWAGTSAAGSANAWGFYVPKAQWGQVTPEDHDGMYGESLPFMVNDNGSDPEISLCVA